MGERPKVLLGFDAREAISPVRDWDAARRELYLLRPEVTRPLSVDALVWPSVFERLTDLGWTGPVLNEHHLFGNPATARAFRDATDARVPEHAPFFVYCLLGIADAEE